MEHHETDLVCSTHGQPVTSYCMDHETTMCMECLLTSHKCCIQAVVAIKSAVTMASEQRAELLSKCRELEADVMKTKLTKESTLKNLAELQDYLRTGIRQMRLSLLERINMVAKNALELVKSVMSEQMDVAEGELSRLTGMHRRLASTMSGLSGETRLGPNMFPDTVLVNYDLANLRQDLTSQPWIGGDIVVQFFVAPIVSEVLEQMTSLGECLVSPKSDMTDSCFDSVKPSATPDLLDTSPSEYLTAITPFRCTAIGADYSLDEEPNHANVFVYETSTIRPCNMDVYTSIHDSMTPKDLGFDFAADLLSPPENFSDRPKLLPRISVSHPDICSVEAIGRPLSDQREDETGAVSTPVLHNDQRDQLNIPSSMSPEMLRETLLKDPTLHNIMPTSPPQDRQETKGSTSSLHIPKPPRGPDAPPLHRPSSYPGSRSPSPQTTSTTLLRHAEDKDCLLTGLVAVDDETLVAGDYNHDNIQLIAHDGKILDTYTLKTPYGVCATDSQTVAVTSTDRRSICVFKIDGGRFRCQKEERIFDDHPGYGISFCAGLFSVACHTQVRLVTEELVVIQVIQASPVVGRPRSTLRLKRKQPALFTEATFTVISGTGDRGTRQIYVSDYAKGLVLCLDGYAMETWRHSLHGPRGLLLHDGKLYVVTKKKLVVLCAETGRMEREVKRFVPKDSLALACDVTRGMLLVTCVPGKSDRLIHGVPLRQ